MAGSVANDLLEASLLRGARQLGTVQRGAPVVAIEEPALEDILNFSDQDLGNERGGFLLGQSYAAEPNAADGTPSYVVVRHFHPARDALGGPASLVFTHDTWADLTHKVQANFPDERLVGWHHTHPGLGVFLSGYDRFIHTHFFAEPWQIALVVDPRRHELGFFQWREGEIRDCGFLCLGRTGDSRQATC